MWISSLLRQKSISSSRSFKIDLRNMISWCHLPKGRIGSFRHLMACIFSGILEIGRFSSDLPAAIGPTATAAAGSGLPPAGRQRHGVHRPGAGADPASNDHPSPHAPKRRLRPSRPIGPPGTSGVLPPATTPAKSSLHRRRAPPRRRVSRRARGKSTPLAAFRDEICQSCKQGKRL